jgi:kinesin family member 5
MLILPSPWLISRYSDKPRKVSSALCFLTLFDFQAKLEAQYTAKREAHLSEVVDLKAQLEMRSNEVRSLNTTVDGLKSVNEELKVGAYMQWGVVPFLLPYLHIQRAFAVTSAGIEGGKNLAESAQDLERTRKAINVQLAEFEGVKKSLMRDLQNRCEKAWKRLTSIERKKRITVF